MRVLKWRLPSVESWWNDTFSTLGLYYVPLMLLSLFICYFRTNELRLRIYKSRCTPADDDLDTSCLMESFAVRAISAVINTLSLCCGIHTFLGTWNSKVVVTLTRNCPQSCSEQSNRLSGHRRIQQLEDLHILKVRVYFSHNVSCQTPNTNLRQTPP